MLDRHGEWIRKTAAWLSRRFRVEADEAAQLLALHLIEGRNRKYALLLTIRTLVQRIRRTGVLLEDLEPASRPSPDPSFAIFLGEVLQGVELQIITLRFLEGLNLGEVRHAIGLGEKESRRLYRAALSKLRDALETQDHE